MKNKNPSPYSLTTLKNGLRILTVPMPHRDSSAVALWFKVGGRYENERVSGVSHFLEHMVFKGTKNRTGKQIRQEIEGVGGLLNAFTGEESTCFFAKLLRPHAMQALEILSDMLLYPTLDRHEFDKEKTVILEEIKMYRDLPSHLVHEQLSELMWPDHPLGRAISGSIESVSELNRTKLAEHWSGYYHPENCLVSVAGNFDHTEVVREVSRLWNRQKQKHVRPFQRISHHQNSPSVKIENKKTEQTHLALGVRTFSRFHPERYSLALLNVILGANMSSRLFEEVREKLGLAYEIRSGNHYYHDTGALTISAGVEAHKALRTIQVVLQELQKLKRFKVSTSEIRRAKDFFHSQFKMALEDTLDHLLWAGERVLDGAAVPNTLTIEKKIEMITPNEIQQVAKTIFNSNHLNLSLIGPLDEKVQDQIKKIFLLD